MECLLISNENEKLRINELESTTYLFFKIRWRNGNQISMGPTNLRMIIGALVLRGELRIRTLFLELIKLIPVKFYKFQFNPLFEYMKIKLKKSDLHNRCRWCCCSLMSSLLLLLPATVTVACYRYQLLRLPLIATITACVGLRSCYFS